MIHELEGDPDFHGAKKDGGQVNKKRSRQAAMIAPDLLQPSAEIGDMIKKGPSACLTEGHEPPHDRVKCTEIQRQEKSAYRRQCDGKHHECDRPKAVRSGHIKSNANSSADIDQQAYDLNENINQHAGDGQIDRHAKLGEQPRTYDVAADHRKRK